MVNCLENEYTLLLNKPHILRYVHVCNTDWTKFSTLGWVCSNHQPCINDLKNHACLQKTSTDKHAAEVKCKAVNRGTQSKRVFGWQRLTGQTLIFTTHWDRKNICWIMHTQPLTYSHIDTHLQMTSVTFYSESGWKHIHTVCRTSSVPPDYPFSKLHWASEFFRNRTFASLPTDVGLCNSHRMHYEERRGECYLNRNILHLSDFQVFVKGVKWCYKLIVHR